MFEINLSYDLDICECIHTGRVCRFDYLGVYCSQHALFGARSSQHRSETQRISRHRKLCNIELKLLIIENYVNIKIYI